MGEDVYEGRLQTEVKHKLLKTYLTKMGFIVGGKWSSITYIDGFSGPWKSKDPLLKDTSFAIAIDALQEVQRNFLAKGKKIRIRCFFIEKAPAPFKMLKDYVDTYEGSIEISIENKSFEDSLEQVCEFIRQDQETFPFAFIDPTGWTGFPMESLEKLFSSSNNFEAVINLMTGHLHRFVCKKDHPMQPNIEKLFGTDDYIERIKNLSATKKDGDIEEGLVPVYCENLSASLKKFVCTAAILRENKNRMHFRLVFLTQSLRGVTAFKEVEKSTARKYEKKRKENMDKNPTNFLFSEMNESTPHYDNMRKHYLKEAIDLLNNSFAQNQSVLYNDLLYNALKLPFVWESDVKDWIFSNKDNLLITSQIKGKNVSHTKITRGLLDIKNNLILHHQ